MQHWLVKSEPGSYSIEDLQRDQRTPWDGVRNHQARNMMRDRMQVGDLALFYHSNAQPSGVAGVARVASHPYPDPTQFDPSSPYHDPRSDPDAPTWFLVDLAFVQRFQDVTPLEALRRDARLDGMLLLQKGQRLSVMPVEKRHFDRVLQLSRH